MNKIYNVAIVGGGASGLMCALELLSGDNPLKSEDMLVLERNDRVGKKLVATGNGQCNLSNASLLRANFHGDKDFLDAFFSKLKNFDIDNYFKGFGIYLKTDEEGRKYPVSLSANSFLDIILEFLNEKNCNIITNERVTAINKRQDVFKIESTNSTYYAKNVILAVGGSSGAQFGTDGSAYNLATNFNHSLSKLYPSLVQLKTQTDKIKSLKGIKEKAKVYAESNGTIVASAEGDLLFTEYGVSGSTIFKISSNIVDKPNANVVIEFLPEITKEELIEILTQRSKMGVYTGEKILWGLVNKRIASVIYKNSKSTSIKDLVYLLKNFTLKVTGTLGFNYSQVTKGGINTKDVNPFSLKSKKQNGLYLIGEVLDVDGDCGGYNLTFAFSSAVFCAQNIKTFLMGEQYGEKI